MDIEDEVGKNVCTAILQRSIRQHRYRLKHKYWPQMQNLTVPQALLLKPDNLAEKSWEKLVTTWFDDDYKVQVTY